MKGVIGVAYLVFKWGMGAWLGLMGIVLFVVLFFWIMGLIAITLARFHEKRHPQQVFPGPVKPAPEVKFGRNTL